MRFARSSIRSLALARLGSADSAEVSDEIKAFFLTSLRARFPEIVSETKVRARERRRAVEVVMLDAGRCSMKHGAVKGALS